MYGYGRYGQYTYWQSVLRLIGHLVGTAVIFASFLALAWLVAVFVHWLHALHPFPEEIYTIVTKVELVLLYVDIGLCGFVLVTGAWRFVREVTHGR